MLDCLAYMANVINCGTKRVELFETALKNYELMLRYGADYNDGLSDYLSCLNNYCQFTQDEKKRTVLQSLMKELTSRNN